MSESEQTPEPELNEEDIKKAEEEEDESGVTAPQDTLRFPPPSPELVEKCRATTTEELTRIDTEIVEKGMFLFFNNQFKEAEELFAEHYKSDPLVANAYGTLGTIKAMLSFEGPDIEESCNRLLYSNHFAAKIAPQGGGLVGAVKSVGKSVGAWFGRKQKKLMTTAEFRALICMGESELLRANVLLLNNSMTAYLKAGFCLRRGYNIYDRLQKYVKEYPDEHGADAHSLGGMHFGLGAIHVVTSIFPPKILALVKVLGYMHDRKLGFEHLQKCLDSKTLRAPIASLFMLAFHGMLPSFAVLTVPSSVPKAEAVIEQTLAMFPKSVIHLWLAGRVARLKRNVPEAITTLNKCVSYGDAMKESLPQLRHFALYDVAFTYMSELRWKEASACFKSLEEESNWSRMFYAYAQGCCAEQEGDFETAIACFKRAEAYPSIKIAGKVISVEQFVKKRLPVMIHNGFSTLDNPLISKHNLPKTSTSGIELMMHFNVFPQTQPENLSKILAIVGEATEAQKAYAEVLFAQSLSDHGELRKAAAPAEAAEPSSPATATEDPSTESALTARKQEAVEKLAFLTLATANLHRELGKYDEAAKFYQTLTEDAFLDSGLQQAVTSSPVVGKRKKGVANATVDIVEELWIRPYTLYELGVCKYKHATSLTGAATTAGAGGEAPPAQEEDVKRLKDEGKQAFEKVKKQYNGKDYSFEMQMQFRLHLTNDALPTL